jgi:hypothetical protein
MKTYHALCLLFVLIYTAGSIERMGLPEIWTKFLVELAIAILAVSLLIQARNRIAPGWSFVIVFVGLCLLSGFFSGDGFYSSLLYFRVLVYEYIVFWAAWNARLTRTEIYNLNRLVLSLWLLQVVVSIYHIFIQGERIEANVGSLISAGGSPATVFPLFAMVYLMAFYCYYKRSVWFLLIGLGFTLVGYSSGKRAIYFYLPIVYWAVLIVYAMRERVVSKFRTWVLPILIFVICIPILIYGLTQSRSFMHLQGNGIGDIVVEAFDMAQEYDGRILTNGMTAGRSATSMQILVNLFSENFSNYLLGLGPSSTKNIGGKWGSDKEGILYGMVGWTQDTLAVGWPAMIAHVTFYLSLWYKLYRRRVVGTNSYAKALLFGCHFGFIIYFLMYFAYTDAFSMAGWLTYAQLYFLAILLSPNHYEFLQPEASKRRAVHRRLIPVAEVSFRSDSGNGMI